MVGSLEDARLDAYFGAPVGPFEDGDGNRRKGNERVVNLRREPRGIGRSSLLTTRLGTACRRQQGEENRREREQSGQAP